MSDDERTVLRAAATLTGSEPWLIEYSRLVPPTGLAESRVRSAAHHLHSRAYCIVTFGGLQLTAAGMRAAAQV